MGMIQVFELFSTAFTKSGAVNSSIRKGKSCAKIVTDKNMKRKKAIDFID